jgi:hypothetical protein
VTKYSSSFEHLGENLHQRTTVLILGGRGEGQNQRAVESSYFIWSEKPPDFIKETTKNRRFSGWLFDLKNIMRSVARFQSQVFCF